MTPTEYIRVKNQLSVLEEMEEVYSGRTLDNIIMSLRSRIKEFD